MTKKCGDNELIKVHCCDCQTDTMVSGRDLNWYRGPEYDCDCGKVIDYDRIEDGVMLF